MHFICFYFLLFGHKRGQATTSVWNKTGWKLFRPVSQTFLKHPGHPNHSLDRFFENNQLRTDQYSKNYFLFSIEDEVKMTCSCLRLSNILRSPYWHHILERQTLPAGGMYSLARRIRTKSHILRPVTQTTKLLKNSNHCPYSRHLAVWTGNNVARV